MGTQPWHCGTMLPLPHHPCTIYPSVSTFTISQFCFLIEIRLATVLVQLSHLSRWNGLLMGVSTSSQRHGSIPGSGRFPGEGNGNPLQYSCLGNPMERGAWRATTHGVAKESDTTECTRLHVLPLVLLHIHSFYTCYQINISTLQLCACH